MLSRSQHACRLLRRVVTRSQQYNYYHRALSTTATPSTNEPSKPSTTTTTSVTSDHTKPINKPINLSTSNDQGNSNSAKKPPFFNAIPVWVGLATIGVIGFNHARKRNASDPDPVDRDAPIDIESDPPHPISPTTVCLCYHQTIHHSVVQYKRQPINVHSNTNEPRWHYMAHAQWH
jgi:hypothetical protein